MEAFRQEIIVGAVVLYMLFCVFTGLWAMKRTHDSSDFFIAGRGLGPIVVALALMKYIINMLHSESFIVSTYSMKEGAIIQTKYF